MHIEGISEYGKVADTDDDERQRALALSNQVPMLLAAQQPERAYEVCQRAIAQFRRIPEMLPSLGNTLGWLGNCLRDLDRPVEALKQYEHSMKILRLCGDKRGVGNQYGNIANALCQLTRYDEAMANYKMALEIANDVGNVKGIINQYVGLSIVFLEKKQFGEALRWAEKGAVIASDFGDTQLASYLRSLADEASRSLP
jgi:tetratricopeptide (TPR) repeat protein